MKYTNGRRTAISHPLRILPAHEAAVEMQTVYRCIASSFRPSCVSVYLISFRLLHTKVGRPPTFERAAGGLFLVVVRSYPYWGSEQHQYV